MHYPSVLLMLHRHQVEGLHLTTEKNFIFEKEVKILGFLNIFNSITFINLINLTMVLIIL